MTTVTVLTTRSTGRAVAAFTSRDAMRTWMRNAGMGARFSYVATDVLMDPATLGQVVTSAAFVAGRTGS
jgi:hypothetical protein